jgi:hypothetical protein
MVGKTTRINMSKAKLLWEECHAGQKNNNISPPPTTPSSHSKAPSSIFDALDVLVVKERENIKPTITRGLCMMESSLLSTQARTKIISASCVVNGLLIVELPSLNEMKQGNSLLTNIMIRLKGS